MPVKEFNPQYVSDFKSEERGLDWAKQLHADLVKSGKRSEQESEESDIVQEVKEVIKEVAEKTTEE